MSHDHHSHEPVGKKALIYSIGLNVLISAAQAIGAVFSGSYSLLSDALHNLTDVFSLVVSLIATILGTKRNTSSRTFGFQRAEIMAAFFNALTLLLLAGFLIFEAIIRFNHEPLIRYHWVIWMASASIVVNGLSIILMHADSKKSLNIKSSYLHLFTDMLTSIAVLAGGILMRYFAWFWVDSLLTILIGIFLVIQCIPIISRSLRCLLMFTPPGINIEEIAKKIEAIEGIKNIHHVHVWEMNDRSIILEGHIDLTNDFKISEFEKILENIEELLEHDYNIRHVNIQPEIFKCDSKKIIA